MPYKRRFLRRPRRKIIRRRGGLGKKRVSKAVKRYVKKAIHKNIENKERILYAANQSITVGDVNTMTYPLIPTFTQGTADDNRVGNQIRCVKGKLDMCINLKNYDATTNPQGLPQWVKIWVVRSLRTTGQLTTIDSAEFGGFFRGNGTSLGFQSNPLDMTLAVNESLFRVLYSKTFKLGGSTASTQSPTNYSYFDNSAFARKMVINYGKWLKKQLKFNDTSSGVFNANLYLVIQAVPCDGANAAGKIPIEWHYTNTFTFEDA